MKNKKNISQITLIIVSVNKKVFLKNLQPFKHILYLKTGYDYSKYLNKRSINLLNFNISFFELENLIPKYK